ncbi:MAG: DUF1565 domain-containing protein [Gemmatimonadetes bacterium]|nr:DUF1565 domain-containing protein [Gemmatimonadota bacterium]
MTRRFNPGHPAWCVGAWLLLLSSLSASAATYHVDPAGTDSASGSETAPWRTLQHAVEQVQPGDRILVRSGRYSGARIEEEVVVTKDGVEVITRFPAEQLMVAGLRYHTASGPLPATREAQSHLNRPGLSGVPAGIAGDNPGDH